MRCITLYFNPRSPHGERRKQADRKEQLHEFQSTLPAWGATKMYLHVIPENAFQSTLPAWGATMGDDCRRVSLQYFNPRSPHGERRTTLESNIANSIFQSTLPAWGATLQNPINLSTYAISIHAPRMGSDSTAKAYSNDRIKWSTLREPHFFYSKNACFSPIVSMCATTSRTKKSENQSFIRIISRLGPYVFHLRLVSIPQIIEPYAVRLLVHQHFQCGTK